MLAIFWFFFLILLCAFLDISGGGRAKEAQREFIVILKAAIRLPDISKSVQRFQLPVKFAFCGHPRRMIKHSRVIFNRGSVVSYSNQLKQARAGMKAEEKTVVNKVGPSKINPPNNYPSNPVPKLQQLNPAVDI